MMTTNNTVLLDHPLYVKSKVQSIALKRYMLYNIQKRTQYSALIAPLPDVLENKVFNITVY